MRVVGKGSWKEREVGKYKVGKFRWSLKESNEVEKNRPRLERFFWSWKVSLQLESSDWKVWMNLESSNFPTSLGSFQLRSVLSNFARFSPTSLGSFQLRLTLSTFSETFQLKTFQLLLLSNCSFQLHVSQKLYCDSYSGNTTYKWGGRVAGHVNKTVVIYTIKIFFNTKNNLFIYLYFLNLYFVSGIFWSLGFFESEKF